MIVHQNLPSIVHELIKKFFNQEYDEDLSNCVYVYSVTL